MTTEQQEIQIPFIKEQVDKICEDYDGDPTFLIAIIQTFLAYFHQHYPAAYEPIIEFDKRIRQYESGEAWTLDEAFGLKDHRKHAKQPAYTFRYRFAGKIYQEVEEERKRNNRKKPDRADFEAVAERYSEQDYPCGDKTVENIWRDMDKQLDDWFADRKKEH